MAVTGIGDLSLSPRLDLLPTGFLFKVLARPASAYVNRQIERAVAEHREDGHEISLIQPRERDDELAAGRQWNFAADSFHPNERGHAIWSELAAPTLARAVSTALRPGDREVETTELAAEPHLIHCRLGWARIRHRRRELSNWTIVLISDAPNGVEHYDEWFERDIELDGHPASVLAIEMPGLGISTADRRFDFSLRAGADWILSVFDHEAVSQAIVATCCINGLWAAKAAQIDPRVAGLVLGQTPDLEGIQRWGKATIPLPLRIPVVGDVLTRLSAGFLTRRWYAKTLFDRELQFRFEKLAGEDRELDARWRLGALYRAIRRERVDPFDHLDRLGPGRIRHVWGLADQTHTELRAAPYRATPVGKAGHFPDLEDVNGVRRRHRRRPRRAVADRASTPSSLRALRVIGHEAPGLGLRSRRVT